MLTSLPHPAAARQNIRLLLWRDDLLHPPPLPGNKARKLKYNLLQAKAEGQTRLLTFGGAYSNHLAAVAAAGRLYGFGTVGVVRGDELARQPLNPVLSRCQADGMGLRFVSRADYRRRTEPAFLADLQRQYGPAYLLPEGGTNALALRGVAELVSEVRQHTDFTHLAVAAGTGGTLAGLVLGLAEADYPARALGVAVLQGGGFLRDDIAALLAEAADVAARTGARTGARTTATTARAWPAYELHLNYHFGGYAQRPPELLRFMADFATTYGARLDPIYTSKLLFGAFDLLERGHFAPGSTVVVVHTGGIFQ